MSAVNHFTQGPLTPVLAYVMSCMGSMLGLRLTAQAHASRGASRVRWLLGAAVSIGGTGIWVMHFIAMMGFEVEGTPIKYDVWLTVASALVAILVVGTGLFLVSYGNGRILALLGGGLLTGLGVASMHYLGMYAMNMSAHISYDRIIVAASVVIAVVAATAALWFTLRVKRAVWITGAALVMGVAVSGMHYTGMMAMMVTVDHEPAAVHGADALDFLVPLMTVISLITLTMLLMVILAPSQEELHEDAELVARLELRRRAVNRQAPFAPSGPGQAPPVRQQPAPPLPRRQPVQRQPVFGAPVPDPRQAMYGPPSPNVQQGFPQTTQRSTPRTK
ncbi:MHYT domain-containing protein [Nonomuraea rhizosphaerae]|uniref:MHYT domain-containing protein n=1 Tax=Nonomuraea rhizosphaerae TaxID=2665663 RepID=UPI001FE88528|nr:MHYT domain-containing protein [Nonomuraea rhizosphaerae]